MLVVGDFNINVHNDNTTSRAEAKNYMNHMRALGLELCNDIVTRDASGTIIDHVFSSLTWNFHHTIDTINGTFSDHNIIVASAGC